MTVQATRLLPAESEHKPYVGAAGRAAPGLPAIGIDLLYLDELDALLRRPWFLGYVYAEAELSYARTLSSERRRDFLAGRFAAKEAVLKVLDCGLFGDVLPRHIEVHRAASGRPDLRLTGSAQRRCTALGLAQIAVTLTHKRDVAMALALGHPEWSPTP